MTMISFKQYLSEIFKDPTNVFKFKPSSYDIYEFDIDPKTSIGVNIDRWKTTNNGNNVWAYEVEFQSNRSGYNLSKIHDVKTAIKVYNTVIEIIKSHLKKHPMNKGDMIRFSNSDKTQWVYDKLAAMAAKQLNATVEKTLETSWVAGDIYMWKIIKN